MAIYVGTQKIKPSGIAKVYAGSTLVYQSGVAPTPYRKLSYISSSGATGGQYTNIGIRPTLNTKMEIQAACINTGTRHDGPLCGARHPNGQFVVWFNDNGGSPVLRCANGASLPALSIAYDHVTTIEMDSSGCVIDGVTYTGSTSTMSVNNDILIYAMMQNSNQVDSRRFTGYVYYCKLWESNVLIRNLVPAQRKSDDVVGLYDTVNDVFYTSLSGTGFVAGTIAKENWDPSQEQEK